MDQAFPQNGKAFFFGGGGGLELRVSIKMVFPALSRRIFSN